MRPQVDPITLAAVSPMPTDITPDINGSNSKPAPSVKSHGHGCIHSGKEHPISKYIGVSAINPASFSSIKDFTAKSKAPATGHNFIILAVSRITKVANAIPDATNKNMHWKISPGTKTSTMRM